jgi:hypothetical protein
MCPPVFRWDTKIMNTWNMERSSINVWNVGELSAMPNALRSINDLTLEKSRMYINTVGKSLLIPVFFCAMKGRTLERPYFCELCGKVFNRVSLL